MVHAKELIVTPPAALVELMADVERMRTAGAFQKVAMDTSGPDKDRTFALTLSAPDGRTHRMRFKLDLTDPTASIRHIAHSGPAQPWGSLTEGSEETE